MRELFKYVDVGNLSLLVLCYEKIMFSKCVFLYLSFLNFVFLCDIYICTEELCLPIMFVLVCLYYIKIRCCSMTTVQRTKVTGDHTYVVHIFVYCFDILINLNLTLHCLILNNKTQLNLKLRPQKLKNFWSYIGITLAASLSSSSSEDIWFSHSDFSKSK